MKLEGVRAIGIYIKESVCNSGTKLIMYLLTNEKYGRTGSIGKAESLSVRAQQKKLSEY